MEKQMTGIPIRIATFEQQTRKHRKKRINKKWRKRYGVKTFDLMEHGKVLYVDGVIYMTKKTFEDFKPAMKRSRRWTRK